MSAGAARLAARYPRLWHIIEADGAGPWLDETGLLPATDLYPSGTNRSDFHKIDIGADRLAVLRPQQMPDHRLVSTLGGIFTGRPDLWRRHIDRHVFFWAEPRRRDAFTRACQRLRAGFAEAPVVLTFETGSLLELHNGDAYFATINSGSTVRGGARARRDENTLRPVAEYRHGPVAEVAIRGRVDIRVTLDPPGPFRHTPATHP